MRKISNIWYAILKTVNLKFKKIIIVTCKVENFEKWFKIKINKLLPVPSKRKVR